MNDQFEQASDDQTNHDAATDQPTNVIPGNAEQHRPAGHTAAICLNNLLDKSATFQIRGTRQGVIKTDSIEVAPYTIEWVIGWEVGADKMLSVEVEDQSRLFAPFLSTANFVLFKKLYFLVKA
ncbi:hypothetical protein KFU94_46105 [Chloroflexi bacterium TSY]|nr:hypothetical protein [Chloroflexi bacterium TSY]